MRKTQRCDSRWRLCQCGMRIPPGMSCPRCAASAMKTVWPVVEQPAYLSGPPRLVAVQFQTIQPARKSQQTSSIVCANCGIDFDPTAPEHARVGNYEECRDCASPDVTPRYTGVMIFGGKHGAEIQINADPELTRYMLGASTKHSSVPTPSKTGGKVVKVVTGMENRRHGDSK